MECTDTSRVGGFEGLYIFLPQPCVHKCLLPCLLNSLACNRAHHSLFPLFPCFLTLFVYLHSCVYVEIRSGHGVVWSPGDNFRCRSPSSAFCETGCPSWPVSLWGFPCLRPIALPWEFCSDRCVSSAFRLWRFKLSPSLVVPFAF